MVVYALLWIIIPLCLSPNSVLFISAPDSFLHVHCRSTACSHLMLHGTSFLTFSLMWSSKSPLHSITIELVICISPFVCNVSKPRSGANQIILEALFSLIFFTSLVFLIYAKDYSPRVFRSSYILVFTDVCKVRYTGGQTINIFSAQHINQRRLLLILAPPHDLYVK